MNKLSVPTIATSFVPGKLAGINIEIRLVTDYDFDHILGTDFSSENDRLTAYNRLSLECSKLLLGAVAPSPPHGHPANFVIYPPLP